MTMIRGILSGLIGLFIDDGSLALAILGLIAIVTVAVKVGWLPPLAGSLLLLAGCIALILESVYRAARRKLADRR